MADDDDDAATLLQRLLEDLLIYTPNSLLEPSKSLPSTQDLAAINSASASRALQTLRLYIRPRNEVLRIRRAVTAAFENEELGSGNVYTQHALLKRELEELRNEKSLLEEELRTTRGNSARGKGIQNILVGEMILQKSRKQLQMLRIYKQHLKILLGKEDKVKRPSYPPHLLTLCDCSPAHKLYPRFSPPPSPLDETLKSSPKQTSTPNAPLSSTPSNPAPQNKSSNPSPFNPPSQPNPSKDTLPQHQPVRQTPQPPNSKCKLPFSL
jgi:hypothetical protein